VVIHIFLPAVEFLDLRPEPVNDPRQCRSEPNAPVSLPCDLATAMVILEPICASLFRDCIQKNLTRKTGPVHTTICRARWPFWPRKIESAHFFAFIVVELGKN